MTDWPPPPLPCCRQAEGVAAGRGGRSGRQAAAVWLAEQAGPQHHRPGAARHGRCRKL